MACHHTWMIRILYPAYATPPRVQKPFAVKHRTLSQHKRQIQIYDTTRSVICPDLHRFYKFVIVTLQQYLENDEQDLLSLTESALSKLSQMSDEDFEKLELYPDFDA